MRKSIARTLFAAVGGGLAVVGIVFLISQLSASDIPNTWEESYPALAKVLGPEGFEGIMNRTPSPIAAAARTPAYRRAPTSRPRPSPTPIPRPKRNYQPNWSHDGSQIVFVSDRDITACVYVVDVSGGNLRQLTEYRGKPIEATSNPDGSWTLQSVDPGQDESPVWSPATASWSSNWSTAT